MEMYEYELVWDKYTLLSFESNKYAFGKQQIQIFDATVVIDDCY